MGPPDRLGIVGVLHDRLPREGEVGADERDHLARPVDPRRASLVEHRDDVGVGRVGPIREQVHGNAVKRARDLDARHEVDADGRCRLGGLLETRHGVMVGEGHHVEAGCICRADYL